MKFFGIFMGVLVIVALLMSNAGYLFNLYYVPQNSYLIIILTWIISRDVYDYLEKKNGNK